jgi:hypothetical protein
VIVTVPFSAMATNTSGSSTHPFGMPSRPYFGGSAARPTEGKPAASTSPPRAPVPCRNRRRLMLAITASGMLSGRRALIGPLPALPQPA